MINTTELKKLIKSKRISEQEIANRMGMSLSLLSKKINNVSPMTLIEANNLQRILRISNADFNYYFLSQNMRNAQTERIIK